MEDAASASFKDHMKSRPHVVLVPIPPPGHSQPCVQLAKKLAKSGVVVTIVSSDLHIEELKAIRSKNSASLHPNIRLVGLQDGATISSATFWDVVAGKPTVEAMLSERLESVLREMLMMSPDNNIAADADNESDDVVGPPCCVISDFLALAWVHIPASKLHLECHVAYASPATMFSFLLQVDRLIMEGRVPVTPTNRWQPFSCIPGCSPLNPLDIPTVFHSDVPLDRSGFIYRHVLAFCHASVALVNTFEELEADVLHILRTEVIGSCPSAVKMRNIFAVGPLIKSEERNGEIGNFVEGDQLMHSHVLRNEENPCLQWLNTQAPDSVLYVAFGSGRSPFTNTQLYELAEGLEASRQPFLWILKIPGEISSPSMQAPQHSMSELLPPGFEERVKGYAFIYSGWAPQQEILKHPATGGFMSHCGWNSTLESMVAGVPMLTWPLGAEQRVNARFLVDRVKLAMEIYKEEECMYKKADIETAARKLFSEEGGQVRKRMKDISCMARRAAVSNETIETYVDQELRLLHQGKQPGMIRKTSI